MIQTLGEDDVIGYSWLFPPYRWRFDARAVEPLRALALDGQCLRGKCDDDPVLGYELMKRFAGMQRSSDCRPPPPIARRVRPRGSALAMGSRRRDDGRPDEMTRAFTVRRATRETADTVTLEFDPGPSRFEFSAGQFNMLYALGIGEVPMLDRRRPSRKREHTMRSVGAVSAALCALHRTATASVSANRSGPIGASARRRSVW